MVTCYYHQGTKNHFGVTCFRNSLDDFFARGLFRLTFYSSDKYIFISQFIHLCLHLAVRYLCSVGGSMTHEYECHAIFLCSIQAVIPSGLHCFCGQIFCNSLLVIIYYGSMADKYIIMLQILDTKKEQDMDVATRVSVQLQLTDPDLKSRDRVVKKSEKDSLYAAMDVGCIWLERALAGK